MQCWVLMHISLWFSLKGIDWLSVKYSRAHWLNQIWENPTFAWSSGGTVLKLNYSFGVWIYIVIRELHQFLFSFWVQMQWHSWDRNTDSWFGHYSKSQKWEWKNELNMIWRLLFALKQRVSRKNMKTCVLVHMQW